MEKKETEDRQMGRTISDGGFPSSSTTWSSSVLHRHVGREGWEVVHGPRHRIQFRRF